MNNQNMLDEYLASRHEDPVEGSTSKKPIVEYFCKTCLLNANLEKYEEFERNNVQSFTPVGQRKDVGVIFTIDSIMSEFHFKTRSAHDWGLYQPFVRPNPKN